LQGDREYLRRVIDLLKPKVKLIADFASFGAYFSAIRSNTKKRQSETLARSANRRALGKAGGAFDGIAGVFAPSDGSSVAALGRRAQY
jgi:hypothetical protein